MFLWYFCVISRSIPHGDRKPSEQWRRRRPILRGAGIGYSRRCHRRNHPIRDRGRDGCLSWVYFHICICLLNLHPQKSHCLFGVTCNPFKTYNYSITGNGKLCTFLLVCFWSDQHHSMKKHIVHADNPLNFFKNKNKKHD